MAGSATPERVRRTLLCLALTISSCSSSSGRLTLVTGGETDVFSRVPAPTSLVVDVVDTYGTRTNLTTAKLPTNEIDLGELPRTNVGSIQVTGKDDVGTRLVYGATVGIQFAVLEGTTLPVFVQRSGEWARYPGVLPDGRSAPLLVATARSLLVGGGTDAASAMQVTGYDVATFGALTSITVTRAARSMAVANASALLVDDAGATGLDLAAGTTFDVAAPSGGSYVEVAGGPTVYGEDGEAYIVGAGRTEGAPTVRVLKLDSAGKVTFLTMGAARLGAAVAWAKGRGLLVMGGNETAPGVELLPKGASGAVSLPFPPDATHGASAAGLTDTTVLVAGGIDAQTNPQRTRVFDLTCAVTCTAVEWAGGLAQPLSPTQLFTTSPTTALVIGDDPSGATHTVRLDAASATELTPKIPRQHARAARVATGSIVLVGGGSGTLESFVP